MIDGKKTPPEVMTHERWMLVHGGWPLPSSLFVVGWFTGGIGVGRAATRALVLQVLIGQGVDQSSW